MSDPQTPTDPAQLRAEIERTRTELGDTVQELAAKADVKTRAKQAAGDAAERARRKLAGSGLPAPINRPLPLGAVAAAAAAVVMVVAIVRRRRS